MFSSIGWGEIVLLFLVALFIFGPDRLPTMAKEAAGALQKMRGFVTGARAQIKDELGEDFADLDLRSLNPREFVRRQLLDDDPAPMLKRSNGNGNGNGRAATGSTVSTSKPATARMGESAGAVADRAAVPDRTGAPNHSAGTDGTAGSPPVAHQPPPYDADAT